MMTLAENMILHIYEQILIPCDNPHEVDWKSIPENSYNHIIAKEVLEPTRGEFGITASYNPHVYSDDRDHVYEIPNIGFMLFRKVGERCGNTITLVKN